MTSASEVTFLAPSCIVGGCVPQGVPHRRSSSAATIGFSASCAIDGEPCDIGAGLLYPSNKRNFWQRSMTWPMTVRTPTSIIEALLDEVGVYDPDFAFSLKHLKAADEGTGDSKTVEIWTFLRDIRKTLQARDQVVQPSTSTHPDELFEPNRPHRNDVE